MVTPGRCDPRWVTPAGCDFALHRGRLNSIPSSSLGTHTLEASLSAPRSLLVGTFSSIVAKWRTNAVAGRRSRASWTAFPSWSLGTRVNVACTSWSHPAGVTHGGSHLPGVTLHCTGVVELNPKLQLGNEGGLCMGRCTMRLDYLAEGWSNSPLAVIMARRKADICDWTTNEFPYRRSSKATT